MNERESERSMVAKAAKRSALNKVPNARQVAESFQRLLLLCSSLSVARSPTLARSSSLFLCYTALVRSLHLVSAFEWCG